MTLFDSHCEASWQGKQDSGGKRTLSHILEDQETEMRQEVMLNCKP